MGQPSVRMRSRKASRGLEGGLAGAGRAGGANEGVVCGLELGSRATGEARQLGQRQPLSASLPNTTAVDQATALGGARKAVLSARRSVGRWPLGRTQARAGEVPGSALRSKRMRLPQTKKRRARPPVVVCCCPSFVLLAG